MANTFPIYVGGPHIEVGAVGGAANTAYDGTGTLDDAFMGTVNGSYLDVLFCKAQGACPATKLTVFYHDGIITKFIGEVECEATAAPTTTEVIGPQIDVLAEIGFPDGIPLKAGHIIKIGSTIALPNGYSRIAVGGDF